MNTQLCFNEIRNKGSCTRDQCRFSHNIPTQLRDNKDDAEAFITSKNLYINEFRIEGSCLKRNNCRFAHKISPEQRSDARIIQSMERKYIRIREGKMTPNRNNIGSGITCRHELRQQGSCPWRNECKFSHGHVLPTTNLNQQTSGSRNSQLYNNLTYNNP